ncbi:unnamed protein product [Calypogeia fissa]
MSEGGIDQGGGVTSKSLSDDLHPADGDGSHTKIANVASGDKTTPVQDLVDHHSSNRRAPEVGQKSVARSLMDAGLTRAATIIAQARNMTETLRQMAISAFSPGDGHKELAKSITASLGSLPTLLKQYVWRSSSTQKKEKSFDTMPTPTNSDISQEDSSTTAPVSGLEDRVDGVASSATGPIHLQQVEHQNVEPKAGEEKLDPIELEKVTEPWAVQNGTLDSKVDNTPMDSENLYHQSLETPDSASSAGAKEKAEDVAAEHVAPEKASTAEDVAAEQVAPEKASAAEHVAPEKASAAEAIADGHRSRVIPEAHAYVEAELSKAEAHAQKMLAEAESQWLKEEAKAMDIYKKEELRADSLVHNAEVQAEKLLAEAKSKAAAIGGTAEEEYTKTMADAKTKAEKWLAEIEETKQRQTAEVHDRVEEMILMREFPLPRPERKKESKLKKVKEKVISHIRGY